MKLASLSGWFCLMMLAAFPLKAEIRLPFPGNWQLPPGAAVSAGVLTVASTDREARLARTEIDSRDYIGRTLIVHFDVKYTDDFPHVYDMVKSIVDAYDFPVAYGFPVGHTDDNYPMVEGARVTLTVNENGTELEF